MAFIDWHPSLSVQVKELDAQHQKLVDMVNSLHSAMQAGKGREVMAGMLSGLKKYTVDHFGCEERYMQQLRYPKYDAHRAEHHKFIQQVNTFEKEHAAGSLSSAELLSALKVWMVKHIQGVDQAYGPFLNAKGVR